MLRRWEPRDRPLYLRGVTPVSSLYLMEAQTIHRGTEYLSNQLRKKVIISIFTICTVREGLEETTTGSRDNDSNKTNMVMLVMVSLVTTTLSKEPNPSPSKGSIRQFFPHYQFRKICSNYWLGLSRGKPTSWKKNIFHQTTIKLYIMDFLAELFGKCLEYNTIGTYRSIGGQEMRIHQQFFALIAGAFNKRPPQPK